MLLKKVAFDKVDNVLDVFQSRKKVVFEASYILFYFAWFLFDCLLRNLNTIISLRILKVNYKIKKT